MSSQRNRPRGQNRNSEGLHGEEVQLWANCHSKLQGVVDGFNESSDNVLDIRDHDGRMAEKRDKGGLQAQDFSHLDNVLRKGVKVNDAEAQRLAGIIEELKVVRAVVKAKEEQHDVSQPRSASSRSKDPPPQQVANTSQASQASNSVYDFDGAGDSPVPSPNPAVARRLAGSASKADRNTDRDSVPPSKPDRSTPAGASSATTKSGSAEPAPPQQAAATNASQQQAARSKMVFARGDEVAFKPKPPSATETTDWILGIVQDVRGEGKSRRYRVRDADVDEAGKQKDFRTSASSMILIPREGGAPLPPLERGRVVLALYPNTTTFYKAEVMSMDPEGDVHLKFEGEESSSLMQAVKRRHVVEYRG